MKKKTYIISAIILSIALTIIQSVIAKESIKEFKNEGVVALVDINIGDIISEDMVKSEIIYTESFIKNTVSYDEIINKKAKDSIKKDSIIIMEQIDIDNSVEDYKYLSLNVSKSNFNASDIKKGDFVDILFVIEQGNYQEYEKIWVSNTSKKMNIDFDFTEDVVLIVENIKIEYIDNTNAQSINVSFKVDGLLDELIGFIKQKSVWEIIKVTEQ